MIVVGAPSEIAVPLCRFVAQDDRPSAVGDVDFAALSPYHRTLLTHDGLTTGVIEAWWLEQVTANVVSQREAPCDDPLLQWLGALPGATVLRRQAMIEGSRSRNRYLFAESLLVTTRLPGFSEELSFHGGIGAALAARKLETRRELLWYGRRGEAVASRGYRIFVGGLPALLIQEDFLR